MSCLISKGEDPLQDQGRLLERTCICDASWLPPEADRGSCIRRIERASSLLACACASTLSRDTTRSIERAERERLGRYRRSRAGGPTTEYGNSASRSILSLCGDFLVRWAQQNSCPL